MKARIGSCPFHEHKRWQTRKQGPDLIWPSSESAKCPFSGSSCRASCSSSAHPPLAISVSRQEELQLPASPGNRVAKVVIDQRTWVVGLIGGCIDVHCSY